MSVPPTEPPQRRRRLSGVILTIRESDQTQARRPPRGPAAADAADALVRDTRHGVRRLMRDWRFTIAAVVILALGIGANTAIFSVVNAALFRAQVIPDSDRLVDIYQRASNPGGLDGNSYAAYLDMAAYTAVFAGTTT